MQRALSACRPGTPKWSLLSVHPFLWVLRDQKGGGGSKLGPVANNGENIASGRQSLGMRPRNRRSYGRQRILSAGRPIRGLLGVPSLL